MVLPAILTLSGDPFPSSAGRFLLVHAHSSLPLIVFTVIIPFQVRCMEGAWLHTQIFPAAGAPAQLPLG